MKLAIIGAGKLGMPFALTLDAAGHEVLVYDTDYEILRCLRDRRWPHVEAKVPELLAAHQIKWLDNPTEFDGDIVFIAVQTPHAEPFDGTSPLLEPPEDFDYSYLEEALGLVHAPLVAVVSTVLPGTWKRYFSHVEGYVYTPSFIAMGTVIDDLKRAEFNLIGTEGTNVDKLVDVWRTINDAPIVETGITEAEAIKVAYNSFISAKIALANTWGWLGEKIGFNADAVWHAWSLSERRLLSSSYLKAGVGDGGSCHPRDLIALSWLARENGVYDVFDAFIEQREWHTRWLASMLPEGTVIFGRAFKPESKIDAGSPSLLLAHYMVRMGKDFVMSDDPEPGAWNFIATAHSRYKDIQWPKGSVVIDPHGIIKDQEGVKVMRIGR